jgi:ABC-type uncharacterized transport system auxiliary subunit
LTKFLPPALCLLLSACVSLPGENVEAPARYMLTGPDRTCSSGGPTLALSVIKVGSGLDTDRVARRDAATGQFTYLQGVRWVERTGGMMAQRLAKDLECRGYSVITSHHTQLKNTRLVCEVRALNLVRAGGGDSAEVGLSCVRFISGGRQQNPIQASATTSLRSWSVDNAMSALAESYARVLDELASDLEL